MEPLEIPSMVFQLVIAGSFSSWDNEVMAASWPFCLPTGSFCQL